MRGSRRAVPRAAADGCSRRGGSSRALLSGLERLAVGLAEERHRVPVTAIVAALVGVLQIARRPVAPVAGGARGLLGGARGGDQRRALGRQLGAAGEIGGSVEVLAALDPRLLAHRVRRQRLAAPDREVGVL